MMRKLWTAIAGSFVMLLVMMPSLALAAKKAAANVVIVADTRRLDGIMLWWAQMYNDSHLYFTILTIIMTIPNIVFGFFGMNIGEGRIPGDWVWWMPLAITVVGCFFAWYMLKKKNLD